MRQAKQGICLWASACRRLAKGCTPLVVVALLCARGSAQGDDLSVFHPASQPAASIRDLFYLVLGITGAIFVLVEGALIYSAVRFRQRKAPTEREPAQVYGSQPLEVAWTVAPLLIVFVLFLVVVRSVVEAQEGNDDSAVLHVQVIGHQWWWEFVYPDDANAQATFRTANELHVPATADGQPVRIEVELLSADVIHSFWVPRLAGKTDLIPGRTNRMWFTSEQPAIYFGQCAEFCGMQHANMKLRVVAESEHDFRQWQENERKSAVDDVAVAGGRERFLALACVNCHTIRGTPARGTVGPDLTHLMSRRTIAAGAAENDRDRLRAWIAEPDSIKPGSEMPNMHLAREDVELVAGYLETLQ
jgi:cytochrome c oxidase subunit 2